MCHLFLTLVKGGQDDHDRLKRFNSETWLWRCFIFNWIFLHLLSWVVSTNDKQLVIRYRGTTTIEHPDFPFHTSPMFIPKGFHQCAHLTGRSGPISHCEEPMGRNVLELPDPLGNLGRIRWGSRFYEIPFPPSSHDPKSKTNSKGFSTWSCRQE